MPATITREPAIDEPTPGYDEPVDRATIERTAEALRAKGYNVQVARDRDDARRLVLDLIPDGAEVGQGASNTLEELGVTAELETSGRYDAIRPRLRAMDRATQGTEIRKLGASPEIWVNSAHAVTHDGAIVIVSFGGSQLGPIVSGAGKVILAIGAQKIVPDLDTAMHRIETHSLPLESTRLKERFGIPSAINKIVILNGEYVPGRINIVLIPEAIGF
jgi:LUD domain